MCKRLFCLALILSLLAGFALPALAEVTAQKLSISTVEEFLAFAENCRMDTYSQNLTVELKESIDLSGISFEAIPVFSGTFDGKGHTISGLSITSSGSDLGLFRYLTATAEVRNLAVRGVVQPGGSQKHIGGIAGRNEGRILACSFTGTVSGKEYVGGIAGVNMVTGIIEYCRANGEIYGSHFVGGVAGENAGVIRGSANNGKINTKPQQNDVGFSDITMDTLTNTELSNMATDVGGIAGISSGVIRDCKNLGDVGYRYMSYNIGGIAGTQSGYITGCENLGSVQGRKEIGGIVGQMEPSAVITYSKDTLQILQEQLGELSVLVDRAAGNAQTNAGQVGGQIALLQEQIKAAQSAVDSLLPDSSGSAPDADTTIAALNTLASSLNAMSVTLSSILAAGKNTTNGLSDDIKVIAGKIAVMEEIMAGSTGNIGGSFSDASDRDTDETLTGKVENCTNYGVVIADLNVGGIAGAMAVENDLDISEDWEQSGETSLFFKSELRAVIRNCTNYGVVSAKKQNAGGIVGWQSMGLVKSSTNTGMLISPTASCVGGISGLSAGFIRSSYARCQITASTNAGGIAGKGSIATDCIAMVKLVDCKEKAGAILGEAGQTEEENPISGNYYLLIGKDIGAIDGINYAGKAESIALDKLMGMEALPLVFRYVLVLFIQEDGEIIQLPVSTGGALDQTKIPSVTKKTGHTGTWEGLEKADLDHILFDMTFMPVYTPHSSVIATEKTRENGLPILLLEGTFTEGVSVSVAKTKRTPKLGDRESLLECWSITASEGGRTARFLLPADESGSDVKLYATNAQGDWREVSFTQNGSYLVFALWPSDTHFALVAVEPNVMPWVVGGIGAAVAVAVCAVFVIVRKKRAKSAVCVSQ